MKQKRCVELQIPNTQTH